MSETNTQKLKLKILVVDDSSNLRQVIKRYISTAFDVTFFEAGNGEEALGILQEQHIFGKQIDLVFLDWMMPKMTGFEFLVQLRGNPNFTLSPQVIMLTAETNSEQMNAALKYNVGAYITKPFTVDEIIAGINKLCSAELELKHAV
jgi:CheY-like chemotaxis protein